MCHALSSQIPDHQQGVILSEMINPIRPLTRGTDLSKKRIAFLSLTVIANSDMGTFEGTHRSISP